MAGDAVQFYELKQHFMVKLASAPSDDIFDRIVYVFSQRAKGQEELVIGLARPFLNKYYVESLFEDILKTYSRYAGISANFETHYEKSDNTVHIIKPQDSSQRALLSAISDILKVKLKENSPAPNKKIIAPKRMSLADIYKNHLAKKSKVGYDIERLELGEREGTLDLILKEEKDASFNRLAIISHFQTHFEDCLASLDLGYLLDVDYAESSRKLSVSITPNDAKAKLFLSACASMLEKEVLR